MDKWDRRKWETVIAVIIMMTRTWILRGKSTSECETIEKKRKDCIVNLDWSKW